MIGICNIRHYSTIAENIIDIVSEKFPIKNIGISLIGYVSREKKNKTPIILESSRNKSAKQIIKMIDISGAF
jgi:hypothetical protein